MRFFSRSLSPVFTVSKGLQDANRRSKRLHRRQLGVVLQHEQVPPRLHHENDCGAAVDLHQSVSFEVSFHMFVCRSSASKSFRLL
jgi:hypothetical protein